MCPQKTISAVNPSTSSLTHHVKAELHARTVRNKNGSPKTVQKVGAQHSTEQLPTGDPGAHTLQNPSERERLFLIRLVCIHSFPRTDHTWLRSATGGSVFPSRRMRWIICSQQGQHQYDIPYINLFDTYYQLLEGVWAVIEGLPHAHHDEQEERLHPHRPRLLPQKAHVFLK